MLTLEILQNTESGIVTLSKTIGECILNKQSKNLNKTYARTGKVTFETHCYCNERKLNASKSHLITPIQPQLSYQYKYYINVPYLLSATLAVVLLHLKLAKTSNL